MKKWLLALVFFALSGASLDAQTVAADRFRLNPGPCYQRAGSGSPEGVIAGNICDEYVDIETNDRYEKVAGAAGTNTGWRMQVGPSAAACTDYATCSSAAKTLSWDYLTHEHRLMTDPEKRLRTYVDANGARLQSYDGSGYRPFWLQGSPVIVAGGGLHVGAGGGASDPGLGNVNLTGFIGSPGFVSQTDKWRIDAAGGADFRHVFTDELLAKAFVADLEQALAGGQIITKSVAVLAADFTVPAAGDTATLVVKDLPSAPGMAVFESGDLIRLRTFARASGELSVTDAWGTVSDHDDNEDGTQDWTFTRLAANGGAMSGGTVIAADAIVLDYGVAGNGWYEVSAVDGVYGANAPYAQVVTWDDDSPAETSTLRVRIGNLRGVTGQEEFGGIFGTYAATDGEYFRCGSQVCEMHGVPLSFWNGATKVIEMNASNPSLAMGATLPSGYGSGTGVWMGIDDGVVKARVGVPGGNGWFFDGSKLTWKAANTELDASGNLIATSATLSGSVTATTGAIGGWTLAATSLTSGTGSTTVGLDSGGTNPAIYAGSATPGSAPFRVTNTGALIATSATITGAITATSGSVTGAFTVGTGGSIASGATGFTVGTGWWLDYNAGTPRFRVGNPAGNRFLFDGSDIELRTGAVQIDNGSIQITAGTNFENRYNISDGSHFSSSGGRAVINGNTAVSLDVNGSEKFSVDASGVDNWAAARFHGSVTIDSVLSIDEPAASTANDYPLVWRQSNQLVYYKTDGVDGTQICAFQGVHHITVERGIVTQVTCLAEPAPSAEYASLREEVADLRTQINLLLAAQPSRPALSALSVERNNQ